jgi:hypothetical protein
MRIGILKNNKMGPLSLKVWIHVRISVQTRNKKIIVGEKK